MKCLVCNLEITRTIANHLKTHNISKQEYYDKYIKSNNEGICQYQNCNNPTRFKSVKEGYAKFCCQSCNCKQTHIDIQNDPERKAKWTEHSRKILEKQWQDDEYRKRRRQEASENMKNRIANGYIVPNKNKPKDISKEQAIKQARLDSYQHEIQTFECPLCNEYKFTGVSSKGLKMHINNFHNIKSEKEWIKFLREIYWPKYYPNKVTHCVICGGETRFRDFGSGFSSICSVRCQQLLITGQGKERYDELAIKDEEEKRLRELYPNEEDFKEFKRKRESEKVKKTCLEKYGCEHFSQSKIVKEKKRKTCLEKFGYNTNLQAPETKEKISKAWNNKSTEEKNKIIAKRLTTNQEKYGGPVAICDNKVKETMIENNKLKFGVDYPTQNEEIKTKMRKTNMDKYGNPCSLHCEEISNKTRETWINKYGEDHPFKNKEFAIKASIKQRENNKENFYKTLNNNRLELISTEEHYLTKNNLILKCKDCNKQFEYNYDSKLVYIHCPNCYMGNSSKYERIICNLLDEYNITYFRNKRLIRYNGKNLEIDIYIPKYKFGIEVNGLYWHKNDCERHIIKSKLMREQHSASLLHITDYEVENKWETIKHIILNRLNLIDYSIDNIKINTITNNIYKQFCGKYDLQGHKEATILLGLYNDNKLISVCSFTDYDKESELVKFCGITNEVILQMFIIYYLNINKHPIINYYDRRIGLENLYLNSEFNIIEYSNPRCWYFSQSEYWLHDENTITNKENWYKYYDCGVIKMKYSPK